MCPLYKIAPYSSNRVILIVLQLLLYNSKKVSETERGWIMKFLSFVCPCTEKLLAYLPQEGSSLILKTRITSTAETLTT